MGVVGVVVVGWGSRSSDDGSSHIALRGDLDMLHGTFVRPDLTTFTRLDELGLEVVAQRVEPGQASLVCRVVDPDEWCHRGGAGQGHPAAGSCPVRVAADDAVLAGTGPARLLDMVEGRSKAAVKAWLAQRPKAWCDGVEVVAMDRFTGSTTAASEELPTATAVMDPLHAVCLTRGLLEQCRRRVQQRTPWVRQLQP